MRAVFRVFARQERGMRPDRFWDDRRAEGERAVCAARGIPRKKDTQKRTAAKQSFFLHEGYARSILSLFRQRVQT